MTRSKGKGRGRAPGSRRALAEANVLRSLKAQKKRTQAEDGKPKAPHLQPFQTSERLEELRARKAAKRPEAVAARRTQEEAERRDREEAAQAERLAQQAERQAREEAAQAAVERFAQEVEHHRNRPITILTASRWLGESPQTTLTRVLSGGGLRAVTMEDGSLRVRAADVERLIRTEAGGWRPVYHTPSARPCVADGLGLAVSEWEQIFGAAHPPYLVVPETVTDCPKCGRVAKAAYRGADGRVRFRCSTFPYCDYLAIAEGDGWARPPEFIGPWSAPAPARVVERHVEAINFAEARDYFGDREADLMPDFEIPTPRDGTERQRPVPLWVVACWLGDSLQDTLALIGLADQDPGLPGWRPEQERRRLDVFRTNDRRVLIAPAEVLRLITQDAAHGIGHRYLERLPVSATPPITVSTAALILGEPPCQDESVVSWPDACQIFGRAADRLYADPPPFDSPKPVTATA